MTDKQLRTAARLFRQEIVGPQSSHRFCFMVCAPLAGYLRCVGEKVEIVEGEVALVEGDYDCIQHCWIRLPDGRVLDPTGDQFNAWLAEPMPQIYLGIPREIHQPLDGRGRLT